MKTLVSSLLAAALLAVCILPAYAETLDDAMNQKYYIEDQLNNLSKQKQTEQKNLSNKKSDQQYIDSLQKKESKELQQIRNDLAQIEKQMGVIDKSIEDAVAKYDNQKELLKSRLKAMYKNTSNTYLQTLIESQNLNDFIERVQLVAQIAKRDKQLAESLEQAKKDIEIKKELKAKEYQDTQKKATDKQRAVDTLTAQRASVENDIKRISSNLSQLESQIDKFNNEAAKINSLIVSLQSKGSKYVEGSMVWPTPGYGGVSSYYGYRLHPILNTYKMHTGIDISAPSNATIVAANKGKVIVAGWQDGYGNTVIIDHGGGVATLYAHSSRLLVSRGAMVDAGDPIAKVGSTGLSTGPHLHFEVRVDGATQDPLSYVSP